jgi:hypothetical protein
MSLPFTQLTGALKLLLHPGDVLSAHSPFKIGPALLHLALGGFNSPDAPLLPAWTGAPATRVRVLEVVLRTLPIWLTLVLLLVTHVPALKLQDLLRRCVVGRVGVHTWRCDSLLPL